MAVVVEGVAVAVEIAEAVSTLEAVEFAGAAAEAFEAADMAIEVTEITDAAEIADVPLDLEAVEPYIDMGLDSAPDPEISESESVSAPDPEIPESISESETVPYDYDANSPGKEWENFTDLDYESTYDMPRTVYDRYLAEYRAAGREVGMDMPDPPAPESPGLSFGEKCIVGVSLAAMVGVVIVAGIIVVVDSTKKNDDGHKENSADATSTNVSHAVAPASDTNNDGAAASGSGAGDAKAAARKLAKEIANELAPEVVPKMAKVYNDHYKGCQAQAKKAAKKVIHDKKMDILKTSLIPVVGHKKAKEMINRTKRQAQNKYNEVLVKDMTDFNKNEWNNKLRVEIPCEAFRNYTSTKEFMTKAVDYYRKYVKHDNK